ncbi:uncharacterized protein F4822DRAFT_219379 [Hypoxylon trugodes]|uniref:uncharacterized protein n=1 Tax=Hypoxylon trugodes TaxID=326681 RepID=UPI0021A1FD12|nr:uncharacterized protein F4822DRAFT_219379 [Hypoxylon trugodes]KAI1389962.1 hypothetical protein F4822DRAFT_219379 [Hypoxylon trugodes]
MHYLQVLSVAALQFIPPAHGDLALEDVLSYSKIHKQRQHPRVRHDARAIAADASPCAGNFEKPSYRFSDFQFNKTATGDLSMTHFQLFDVANNGSTFCTTPYLQDVNNPAWNDCENDLKDPIGARTLFKYSGLDNELEVSQMWLCELENKTHPHPYFSSAKIDLRELLKCVDDPKQTRCTVEDEDAVDAFGGDYTTPIWSSDPIDIIPPNHGEKTETPWNPTPCIGPSFSYPYWDVQDFSYKEGDDASSVSFRLNNHASNQSVACTAEAGELSSCEDNSTTVIFAKATRELSVNQTWVCKGDEKYPKDVTFRAVGSVAIELDSANSTLIKGLLTEPIALTPNVAPEGVNHPDCIETSETPSWTVSSLRWNEKWRNGYNTGDLTVTFYNPATGFQLTCTGDGEELNPDGRYGNDRWWGCSYARSAFEDYRISSLIKLNPETEIFSIKQTWYCNGHDDKLPAEIVAEGSTDLKLTCTSGHDAATNTTARYCHQTEYPLTVEGAVTNKTELAKDVFLELAPAGYSCTIASVLAPQWRSHWSTDNIFSAPTFANNFVTKVFYGIQFMAIDGFQYVAFKGLSATPFLSASKPGKWYDCKDYVKGEESSSAWAQYNIDCKWQLDLETGYYALNHTWYCDDKDPDHPIVFTASGSRFDNYTCYVDRAERDVSCGPVGPEAPPILPTSIEWEAMPIDAFKARYPSLGAH